MLFRSVPFDLGKAQAELLRDRGQGVLDVDMRQMLDRSFDIVGRRAVNVVDRSKSGSTHQKERFLAVLSCHVVQHLADGIREHERHVHRAQPNGFEVERVAPTFALI